jgi:ATP-dependent RNA helicase RhlE
MSFENLGLIQPILKALTASGYENPTPIQVQAIPLVLQGRDLLGSAQTGTGKTAAFAVPVLQRLQETPPRQARSIRALVLAPTRELAIQVSDSFETYGKHLPLRQTVVYGGVSQHTQVRALRAGVDILIATPGRLMDLINQGFIKLNQIEVFILDEADRMLDMGFIHDIRRIITMLPAQKQTLLFSATMPSEIKELADSLLHNPAFVSVARAKASENLIRQTVYFVQQGDKNDLLTHLLENKEEIPTALVFTRTKYGADKVARHLSRLGILAEAIHGNKSQAARQKALANFKSRRIRVLVATDIAARGIDVDSLSHVINFELPSEAETYVHRIGRTGRAGAHGEAMSFCSSDERKNLQGITRLLNKQIDVVREHPYADAKATAVEVPRATSYAKTSARPQAQRPGRTAERPGRPAERSEQDPRQQKSKGKGKWYGRR